MSDSGTAGSRGAACAHWLGWDGRVLRWTVDVASGTPCELALDGVVFERAAAVGVPFEREFEFSPSGNAELAFSVHSGGQALGRTWRVRFGDPAVAGADDEAQTPPALQPLAGTPRLPLRAWPPEHGIAIVVPIHNARDSVRRCLEALARWNPPDARVILIDDASTDAGIAPLLAAFARGRDVRIERNETNRGYTHSVNIGIARAGDADVVLLNSDTEVGPHWLQALFTAAYSAAAIGTATAVSDNAGAFSVPELEQYCPIPSAWDLATAQRAVLQQAGLRYPELPTGNGFCMYVRRELIARIGAMDATAFPAGYGEENDFCQRAIRAGFRNVIAGNVLVRHERSASFGAERRAALGRHGMAVLRQRYPDYEADIGATLHGFARRVLDYRVRRAYAESGARPPPRARCAVPATDAPAVDAVLGAEASGQHDFFALVCTPQLQLLHRTGSGWSREGTFEGDWQGDAAGIRVSEWLLAYAIEDIQAIIAGPWTDHVVDLARRLGIGTAS